MNKTAKIIISSVCFAVTAILLVLSFLPFVRIVGEWENKETDDGYTRSIKYEFGLDGTFEGHYLYKKGDETLDSSDSKGKYDIKDGELEMNYENNENASGEFAVSDNTLELIDEDETAEFDRIGFAPLWLFRIVAAVFAAVGALFLAIKSKCTNFSSMGYSATAIPASPYDFTPAYAPENPAYAPQNDYAVGAVSPETPVYTPEAPAYTPEAPAYIPEAPAYIPEAPAYTPEAPAYTPEAYAPTYTSEPAAPAYAPSYDNLPKSKPTTDSDRFSTAGDL